MPKLSVVVPVYNGEKYLSLCIDSLLEQSLSDIEILAVDNGSTDSSADILSTYVDKRLKLITLQQNQGPSGARNAALDIATGEYIAFCDCDDTVPQDAYENLYNYAKQTGSDVVVGDYTEVWNDKSSYHKICSPHKNAYVICEMGILWNKLYLRSFLEEHQLRIPNYIGDEDLLFLALLLKCKPTFSMLEHSVYNYFHYDSNITALSKLANLQMVKDNVEARLQYDKIISDLGYEAADSRAFYSCRFVFRKWCNIPDEQERRAAFELIQQFVELSSWNKTVGRFKKLFGIRPDEFACMDYDTFLFEHYRFCFQSVVTQEEECTGKKQTRSSSIPAQVVTEELFKTGKLGFRYIWKYFRNWLLYKLKQGQM